MVPVIDWTEEDQPVGQKKKSAQAFGPKTSWLQRFLLHTGKQDAQHQDHGIEVVLPGKKK